MAVLKTGVVLSDVRGSAAYQLVSRSLRPAMKGFTMRVIMPVDLIIEPKEDETGDGTQPCIPSESELAAYLRDLLADQTRRDGYTGWMVVGVDTSS